MGNTSLIKFISKRRHNVLFKCRLTRLVSRVGWSSAQPVLERFPIASVAERCSEAKAQANFIPLCALSLQTTLLHTTVCVIFLRGSVEKPQMSLRATHHNQPEHNYSFTPAMWRLHLLSLHREMRGSPLYSLPLRFALSRSWFRDTILAGAYGPHATDRGRKRRKIHQHPTLQQHACFYVFSVLLTVSHGDSDSYGSCSFLKARIKLQHSFSDLSRYQKHRITTEYVWGLLPEFSDPVGAGPRNPHFQ